MVSDVKIKHCTECTNRFSYEVKVGPPPKKCNECKIPIAQRITRFCSQCTKPFKHTGDGRPKKKCPVCHNS